MMIQDADIMLKPFWTTTIRDDQFEIRKNYMPGTVVASNDKGTLLGRLPSLLLALKLRNHWLNLLCEFVSFV